MFSMFSLAVSVLFQARAFVIFRRRFASTHADSAFLIVQELVPNKAQRDATLSHSSFAQKHEFVFFVGGGKAVSSWEGEQEGWGGGRGEGRVQSGANALRTRRMRDRQQR